MGMNYPSIQEPLSKDVKAVYEFANEQNIECLQQRKVECSMEQAWEFTAIANRVCSRKGAYRGPAGTTFVFMTFGDFDIKKAG